MYKIAFKYDIDKMIKKFPQYIQIHIRSRIYELTLQPLPADVKLLKNSETYRIRVGNYRILYEIHKSCITILIIDIDHRKDMF